MGNVTFPVQMDGQEKYVAGFDVSPSHTSSCHSYFTGILHDYRNYGPFHQSKCLIKVKKRFPATAKSFWEPELARADKAKDIADQLMKVHRNLKINFVNTYPVEIDETSGAIISTLLRLWTRPLKEYEWVLVSRYIKDVHQLVMNNPYKHPTLETLSHFSWHVTGGEMVLCDFQGTGDNNAYTLLSPTIHSTGQKYGNEDKGGEGIRQFFSRHLCTNLCKSFSHPATRSNQDSGDHTGTHNLFNNLIEQSITSNWLGLKTIEIQKS